MAAGFALITMLLSGNLSGFNLQALLIAACSGMFLALDSLCGIKALRGGTIVLSSIFGTAGLIVPCVLGVFFFDDKLSLIQIICIAAVILSGILLISSSKKLTGKFTKGTLLCLLGKFFGNGMTMFCQKLFGYLQPDGNVSFFSLLTFLIPAVILALTLPLSARVDKKREPFPKKLLLYMSFLAFAVFVIQQLVTMLTPVMHTAVLFTVVNGGATVIAAIVGAILYKEKITVKSAVGVIIGIGALIVIKAF